MQTQRLAAKTWAAVPRVLPWCCFFLQRLPLLLLLLLLLPSMQIAPVYRYLLCHLHKSGPFKSCSSRIACQPLTDTTAAQGLANITSASQTRTGSCTAARYIMLFWENAILFKQNKRYQCRPPGRGTRGCIGHGVAAPEVVPVAVLWHQMLCRSRCCGTRCCAGRDVAAPWSMLATVVWHYGQWLQPR